VGKYELYEPDLLQHERRASFGAELALVGWSLHTPPELAPGTPLSLTVVWQAQQVPRRDYAAFAHLVDEAGQGWAGDDHQPYNGLYPTSGWGAGEMVRDVFTLSLPAGAPNGLYDIKVGWYDPLSHERLSVGGGYALRVGVLPLGGAVDEAQPVTPLDLQFNDAITLQGYSLQKGPEAVEVTLRWTSNQHIDTDYTVFVHLAPLDDPNQVVAQGDSPPMAGRWPTSLWLPGLALDDAHSIPLPPGLPAGRHGLLVGLYDPLTGERLRLPDGSDAALLVETDLP
jgi:hypothetical protein